MTALPVEMSRFGMCQRKQEAEETYAEDLPIEWSV
jgi:hypothetical protein